VTEPHARSGHASWPGLKDADLHAPHPRVIHTVSELRPNLRVGAIFVLNDLRSGASSKDVYRPLLIIAGAVPVTEDDVITRMRYVATSRRVSWKPHFEQKYGKPSADGRWLENLASRQPFWLFTPARLLSAFDKAGFFELEMRRPLLVERLLGALFVGWLPKLYVDLARVRAGSSLDVPYPPVPRAEQ